MEKIDLLKNQTACSTFFLFQEVLPLWSLVGVLPGTIIFYLFLVAPTNSNIRLTDEPCCEDDIQLW